MFQYNCIQLDMSTCVVNYIFFFKCIMEGLKIIRRETGVMILEH